MAGDWIPVTVDLPRKREVIALATATGLPEREVMSICIEFWMWAQGETADGALPGMTLDMLPRVIQRTPLAFWQAMVEVGWLVEARDGLLVPNAAKWITRGAKARLMKTQRQAVWRGKLAAVPHNGTPAHTEKRGTKRCPAAYTLTPAMIEFATGDGLDPFQAEREFAKFKDHTFAKAITDWDGALRNWFRNANDQQHRLSTVRRPSTSHANQDAIHRVLTEVAAKEQK